MIYQVDLIHPITGEIIETRYFNSEYEAELYGREYQKFTESLVE